MDTIRAQKHSSKIKIHVSSEFVIVVIVLDGDMDSATVKAGLYGSYKGEILQLNSITDMDDLGKALRNAASEAREEIALQKKLAAIVDGEIYADVRLEQDNLRDSATD